MAQPMQQQEYRGAYARGEDVGDCDPVNPTPTYETSVEPAETEPDDAITLRISVRPSVDELLQRVQRFNQEIIGLPARDRVSILEPTRAEFRVDHLLEEIHEFKDATDAGDAEEAADALLDLVYVALGALYEMGVNYGPAFDVVHEANMRRVRGEKATRKGSLGHDAVKPSGWQGPDNSWIMDATPEVVELGVLAQERGMDIPLLETISPVFLHVARIRAGKGRDYNTSVGLHDYFPHGHASYHQLMHMKALRARSIVELMDRGMVPNYEGLLDTLYDSLNYTCFWAEAILEGRVPLTGARGAEQNGAVQTT